MKTIILIIILLVVLNATGIINFNKDKASQVAKQTIETTTKAAKSVANSETVASLKKEVKNSIKQ